MCIAEVKTGKSKYVNWKRVGSFVYLELMEKNRGFLKSIQNAKTLTELHNVLEFMLVEAEIDFRVDLEKAESELEGKSLNEQKKCLRSEERRVGKENTSKMQMKQ